MPLRTCCCLVQKNWPIMAELAWQASKYLWMGMVNFKIKVLDYFSPSFYATNVNFKTRDFSPLIEWAGVSRIEHSVDHYDSLKIIFRVQMSQRWVSQFYRKILPHSRLLGRDNNVDDVFWRTFGLRKFLQSKRLHIRSTEYRFTRYESLYSWHSFSLRSSFRGENLSDFKVCYSNEEGLVIPTGREGGEG